MLNPERSVTYPRHIRDVAAEFGVTLRALRFYDSRGLVTPARDGAARLYSQIDVARLALVLKGKKLGFTLSDIKQRIILVPNSEGLYQLTVSRKIRDEQLAHFAGITAAAEESI